MKQNSWKKSLLRFVQGALVGTGAILPGISGGVLCVAFGIYEPMMAFLSHPFRSFSRHFRLLLPVLLGGLVGFVLLAKVVEYFLTVSALAAMLLFCGLICGTVPDLLEKSAAADHRKGWSWLILTLVASFVFFHVLENGVMSGIQPNFGWYLFCGVIWGLSMVVPGLSSSSILLFMGLYQPMAQGIGNLDFAVLVPLMLGFLATVLAGARVMNRVLQHHYGILSKVILGFVISSVLMIVPLEFPSWPQFFLGLACFAAGFVLARWMDMRRTPDA